MTVSPNLPRLGSRPPKPHTLGHSHNDQQQSYPLQDALEAGFNSVEVDLQLIQGKLLIGHDPLTATQRPQTLEETYLLPLAERVQRYGSVYPSTSYQTEPPFQLVLDIKGASQATYRELLPILKRFESILTNVTGQQVEKRPLQIILTGNQPGQAQKLESFFFGEGSVSKVLSGSKVDPLRNPIVSGNYRGYFRWNGEGRMPASESERLRKLADRVHSQGAALRLWGAPDNPNAWATFAELGLDRLNTDHPTEFGAWTQSFPG